MVKPLHYDLAAAEKEMRQQFAMINGSPAIDGLSSRNRAFVHLQIGLQETQIRASLWHLASVNEDADEEMMSEALGRAIGAIVWSFASNSGLPPEEAAAEVLAFAADTMSDMLEPASKGPSRDDVIFHHASLTAIVGGRA